MVMFAIAFFITSYKQIHPEEYDQNWVVATELSKTFMNNKSTTLATQI
jgi:hypothetical protein